MNAPLKILLIEDTESDAEFVQRYLRRCGVAIASIRRAKSLSEAKLAIMEETFDLIITDLGLPESTGVETIVRLRTTHADSPILALTSQDDLCEDLGLKVIRAGANDYIPKDEISKSVIARAIVYTVERFRMAKEVKSANRKLNAANESLEKKNQRLKKMYSMSQQFVDNVSHEFRTPLTVIREFASIMQDGLDGPITDSQNERLGTLINRADDLANMVDDLLDTSRLENGLLKTCRGEHNLSEIVRRVKRMLQKRAASKNITLATDRIAEDLEVYCDEEKLRRVLINLMVNAIKFTPIGGEVSIFAAIADDDRVKISVADNGQGIPADDLHRIFERFQQVESHHRMASCKGFGLGLSIARSLASLNLGRLHVESVVGVGSEFSVTVPRARVASVMNCYLEQRLSTAGEINVVEIIPVNHDTNEDANVTDSIDEFLRDTVKTFDLVMHSEVNRWFVFTESNAANVPEFSQRIENEWVKLKRNHYGCALPELKLKSVMTVTEDTDRQQLINLVQRNDTTVSEHERHETLTPGNSAKHVLVIEDEDDVSEALQSRLRAKGFKVSAASDGKSGLEMINRLSPAAVLLDVRMPVMDGKTVLRTLRANPKTAAMPVVVLSASLRDKQEILDIGANFFVPKPFQSSSIMEALDSVLTVDRNSTGR